MYDKDLAVEILNQILQASLIYQSFHEIRTIFQRFRCRSVLLIGPLDMAPIMAKFFSKPGTVNLESEMFSLIKH